MTRFSFVLLLVAVTLPGALAQVPTVTIAQTAFGAQVATTITLGCSVSSATTVTSVFWQRDVGSGTQTITIDGTNFSGSSPSIPSLTLINADVTDSGTYTCFATNAAGSGNSQTATVTISSAVPTVTIAQTQYSTSTGTSITLQCTVSSTTTVTSVFWQRTVNSVTSTLNIDNVNYSGVTPSSPSLTVINADANDSGFYVCFATNTAGTGQSSSTQLTVSGGVPLVNVGQSAYGTVVGSSINLVCIVSANPALNSNGISWQRNVGFGPQAININGVDYSGGTNSNPSLTVIVASTTDAGTYTCSATNSVGTTSASTTLTVSGTVPTVTIAQAQYSTSTGTSITLQCTVSSTTTVTSVFWQRTVNSVTSTLNIDNVNYSGVTPSSPSLTVINADANDSGFYVCFATNAAGTGQSSSTQLTVTGAVPVVIIAQTAYSTTTGTSITLGCSVSASPAHFQVFWQRNVGTGTQSITIDGVNYSGSTVNSPSLTVLNADTGDTGTYTCFATNNVGTGQSASTTLSVSGNLPTVTVTQVSYSVTTGTTVTLGCSVSANPTQTSVFWQFTPTGGATTSVTIDNVNFGGASTFGPSLTVFNANSGDQGTYVCFASNQVGTGQSAQVSLSVLGNVPTVTIAQTAYSTTTGTSITLGCSVSANPAHTQVFWQRNVGTGTQSITIDGVNYSGSSVNSPSLTVLNVDTGDTGTYTCFATNSVGTGQSASTTLSVSGNVPTVTIAQSVYSTTTGTSITLGCSVSANPAHTQVFWQRNVGTGTQSITIDGVNYSGSTVNSPSLTVLNADTGDTGTYTCFATNSVGTGQSASTTLSVSGNVPTVIIAQTAYSTTTGTSITLGCSVSANPAHTQVFWQRNVGTGTQSITIDGVNYSGSTVNSPSLTVLNADTGDTGTYTCFATNSVGTGQSASTTLSVSGNVPTVTIAQSAYSTTTGTSITLGCSVSANPAHTQVFWQRNVGTGTQSITIDGVNYSGSTVNSPSLTVLNADTGDTGTYTCFATNTVGTGQSASTTLTVTGNVPVVTILQASYSVTTGQTVTLQCTVSATPTHTQVFWQRIDNGIATTINVGSTKYSGSTVNSPSLIIFNTNSNDQSVYTCSATNAVGTGTSGQTTLTVVGNIPVVTIAQTAYSTTTGTSITLGCSVSANPAHTQVFWQRNVGTGTQSITIDGVNYSGSSVNSPSLTVLNADTGDTGTYTCFATNSVGTGQSASTTLSVSGNVPVVTILQASYSVTTGQTVTLQCTVSATPTHTQVFWQRIDNGIATTINMGGTKYSGSTVNSPSLIIFNTNSNDQSVYTCSATNAVGTGTSGQTVLTVIGNIPVVTIAQTAYSTTTGTSITLGCSVSANPAHTQVFWQRNVGTGTQSITIDGVNYSGSTVNSPSLTVLNADTGDTGTYTCFATNTVGTGQSASTTLTVTGNVPVVTILQASYSVTTGQTVTLQCTVSATPTHTQVFWQRIDNGVATTINIDGTKYSGSTVNSPSLIISNTNSNDQSVYTCSATNAVGTGTSGQTTLTVVGNVPVVTIAQTAYSTTTGTSITLGCSVSANPAHTQVFWQRNVGTGTQSITIDGVNYSGSSVNSPSLTVLNADTGDTGTYTCFATNTVGTGQSASTTLTVTGNVPVVTILQASYSVTTGQTVTLQCTVSATPTHTQVFWQRIDNGVATTINIDGTKYSGSTVNSPSLIISSTNSNDQSVYTCSATNAVGTGTSGQTVLSVVGNVPVVTILQASYSVTTGQTVTLQCTVSATPTHTQVFWQRIDNGVASTINMGGTKYSGSTVNSPSLIIFNTNSNDQSVYTCSATNAVGTGTSGQTTLTVVGNIPVVTVAQTAYSTTTGTSITLGCSVSANPAHTQVFWQRNVGTGTQSITIDGVNYSGSTVNAPSLTVLNADTGDTGTYTCFATNTVGTGQSASTTLTVTGNVPVVTILQASYSVTTGQTVTLQCTVSATPTHTQVFWQRIDNGVASTINMGGTKYSGSTVNSPSLIIFNTNSNDQSVYTCSATNAVGTGTSGQTTLTVVGNIPVVTIAQTAYSTTTGTSITLGCSVSANPAHTQVFWQRNVGTGTQSITIDGVNYSGSSVNSPSLTVLNADTGDTGTYTCFATNTVGTGQSASTTLTVTGNVPVVTILQASYSVTTGQTVTLQCTVSATPTHTQVFWQRIDNGVATTINIDGTKYSGSTVNSPSLIISNTNSNDQSVYTCSATNAVGTGTSGQTTLTVVGNIPVVTIAQTAYSTTTGTSITLGCSVSANPAHTQVFWQRNVGTGTQSITIDGVNYSGSSVNSPSLTVLNADTGDTGTYTCFATNTVGTGQSASTTLTVTGNVPVVTILQASYSVTTGQTVTLQCTVSATPTHTQVFWQRIDNGVATTINIDGTKYSGSTVNSPSLIISSTNSNDQSVYTCSATNAVGTGTSGQTVLSVVGNVPVVTILQASYSVTTGQTVTLQCTVSATPTHTQVFWQRIDNGVASTINMGGTKYSGSTVNSPSLIIFNTNSNDQSVYTCSATNAVGTGTSGQTTLTVVGNIPVVTIAQTAYSTTTGTSITLGCSVSANPAHTQVFWQRNVGTGTQSITIDGVNYSGSTVNSPSLTVLNADTGDTGTYTCFATNTVGTGQSASTTLTVTGNVPVVTILQASYSVTTGQTVTLQCTVSATPTHTQVFWQRIDNGVATTINIDGTKYSGSTVNSPSLIISSTNSNDQSVYTCSATNAVGTGTSGQTILSVVGNVPVVTILQASYSVTTGQTVTLQCTVSATPTHNQVFWQRIDNGVATTINMGGTKYSGSTVNSPSLIISNTNSNDQSVYTCSATNAVGTGTSGQTVLSVVGNIPVVTIAQSSYSTTTGTSITLGCSVSANPAHTQVFWQRNVGTGTQSITIDGVNYSGSTVNSPSLTVLNADTGDTGTYTCFATNTVGTGQSASTTLTVTGNVPVVTILQASYSVTTGQTVTLQCTVSATPTHTQVFWQRIDNGIATAINMGGGTKYSGSTVNSPSLIIFNTNSNDQSVYTCSATNAVGTGTSGQTTLTVVGNIPVVTIAQSSYSTTTGTSITLGCSVSANPAHTQVFWQRNVGTGTQSITIDGVNYSGSTVNSPSLTVLNADTGDTGTYTCFATNTVGTGQSASTTLTVTGNVPVVTILQASYSVTTGQTVTLQCTVSATPTHTQVFWQRIDNGVATTINMGGTKYSGSTVNSPSLIIFNTNSNDQSVYTCSATNAVGTGTSGQTVLTVIGNIPVVTIAQSSYSTTTGTSITLGCSVSANPAHTQVFWQRNVGTGTQSITIDGVNYSGSAVNSPSLTVLNADTGDTGTYTCFATNTVGTGQSASTTLTVTGNVPVVTILQASYSVTTGQTVTLQCTVSATPSHTQVFWQRIDNGVATTINMGGTKYSGSTVNSPSLIIFNTNSNDQSVYTCSATNAVGTGTSGQTVLSVVGNVPVVTIQQPTYSVTTGQTVTLQCTVSATPTHTQVFWQRIDNGVATTINIDGTKYSGSTVNSPSLIISSTNSNDQSVYTCSATNTVGTGTSGQTTLTVVGNVPVVTILQASYSVTTGQSVTLQCTVAATPFHTQVFWQRIDNGVATTINIGGNKYSGSTVNSPSLVIFNANSNDQSVYTCSATNAVGTGTSGQTTLTVVGNVPVVTVAQASYTVTTGNTITLVCTVSATPTHTSVSWRRLISGVSMAITIDNNKYTGSTVSTPSLTITNAQNNDEGFYTCQATNIVGTGESTTTYLTVSGTIPVVTIPQATYSILTGSSVTIDCTITAVPAHTSVSWQKTIPGGSAVTITIDGVNYSGGSVNSPSLNVINADSNDQAFYVCTATNSIGTGTSNQAYLSVTGAPPTATVSQTSYSIITGSSVTLQCSVFGSPAVTSVTWTRTNNGGSTTISINGQKYSGSTVNNPSLTISNADSNDVGSYVCSATNSLGTGQSQTVTLTVTGNPPTVTVSQTQYSAISGSTLTIQCSVSAIPAANLVFWTRTSNGVTSQLNIDQVSFGGATVGSPSLIIYTGNNNDDGVYVCKATNTIGTGQSQGVTIAFTGAIPVAQIQQATYTVNTGSMATLVCTVTASPPATSITWRRIINGVSTIITVSGGKYSGATPGLPTLYITNTDSSDIAYYTCSATNAVGTGTSGQTYLDVTGALLTVLVPQSFYTVQRGQSVTLQCTVTGTPSATAVSWRRTSGGVTSTVGIDNSKYVGSSISSPSLVINNADSVDTGTYVCTATNIIGTATSTQTTLSVTGDIPTVTIPDPSYTIVTGLQITIPCTVSANPQHTSVSWTRSQNINSGSTPIVIDGSTYSGGSVSVPSLTILSAAAMDQGYYVCRASNSIGTGTSGQTYLSVTGAIPTVTIPSNAYSVITGGSFQIPCFVAASPPASTITWRKSSGTNTATSMIAIDGTKYQGGTVNTPSLTVNTASQSDQAYYVCSATNSVGSGQSIQTYLTVSGNVPVVTIGQAQYTTILGTSVTLECTVSATPQATTIAWERMIGGVSTTITVDGTKFVGSTIGNPSLTITTASTDDQGYYTCTAINSVGVGRSSQGYLTVTGLVPAVVISKPSYTTVVGDTIIIDCDYSSSPDATSIRWDKIKDTQTTVVVINNSKFQGSTLSNPSLTITNANSGDQAFYRCVVTNSVGEGQSNQAYLYVTGNIPSVTVPQSSYSVSLDESVTITCNVNAIPAVTSVTWEFIDANGQTNVINVASSRYTGGTVSTPSLTLLDAQLTDQASYRCKATNIVGTGSSQQVYLYVTGTLPSVRVTVSAYTVDVDTAATLACIVEASPPATSVYWTKIVNGVSTSISTSSSKYGGSTVGSPSLIINTLVLSDQGSYRCSAVNTVGTGQSGLTSLIVAYAPRNTVVDPTSLTRTEGQSATSECSTDANPAATFRWVKDNTNQLVGENRVLLINNVDRGHDSTYTCTATNSQGSQSARFDLDVQYLPISTVTTVEAAVTLSLNAQRDLECNTVANPAVQTYRWLKDGEMISTANSLVYRVTITDANSYGIYVCYATNTIGESSAITYTVSSGVSPTVTPTVEGLTTGLIIAIVISAAVLLLIIITIICCCVTRGVCRTEAPATRKRVIYEKPRPLQFINPSPMLLPRQEVISMPDDGYYAAPQFQFTPQIAYYESEGGSRKDYTTYT